jgi:TRAP-type C4-dicarboxylate transport system permease small subunit
VRISREVTLAVICPVLKEPEPEVKRKVGWVYEKVLFIGLAAAALLIAAMAVFISADVILRNLGMTNLPWVTEVSEYILFIATFLAAPWILRQGAHVRVDIVLRGLPPKTKLGAQVLANIVGLAVCVFLVRYGFKVFADAFQLKSMIFKQLILPEWWFFALIPITGALLAAEFLLRLYHLWSQGSEPCSPSGGER